MLAPCFIVLSFPPLVLCLPNCFIIASSLVNQGTWINWISKPSEVYHPKLMISTGGLDNMSEDNPSSTLYISWLNPSSQGVQGLNHDATPYLPCRLAGEGLALPGSIIAPPCEKGWLQFCFETYPFFNRNRVQCLKVLWKDISLSLFLKIVLLQVDAFLLPNYSSNCN